MNDVQDILKRNIERAREAVSEALAAAGRPADSVKVVSVSKYVSVELTCSLVEAGMTHLGESRPQSIWQKHDAVNEVARRQSVEIEWHMIGHLQRNKVARTLPMIEWLHSLDSLRLADAINAEAIKQQRRVNSLLEVNVSEDTSKTGLPPEEARQVLQHVLSLPGLCVRGLMAMSTEHATAEQTLREFHRVRELRDALQREFGTACDLSELSMGMSGDFQQGIAAGATMIRIGSLLWEGLL